MKNSSTNPSEHGSAHGYFPDGNKTRDYIRNAGCRFESRRTSKGQTYAVSLPDPAWSEEPTSYLGSITGSLLDYPLSSIPRVHEALSSGTPTRLSRLFLRLASRPRRSVGLFNEPLSNIELPEDVLPLIEELVPQFQREFPDCPIVVRGLVRRRYKHIFKKLGFMGFILVCYRRIFVFQEKSDKDCSKRMKRELGDIRKFRKLLSAPTEPLPMDDYERMAALYRELYLGKYSRINPDYTAAFIAQLHLTGRLKLVVCRDISGRIAGFSAYTRTGDRMSSNLTGHDREMMPNPTAYVLTNAMEAELAIKEGLLWNLGAGSSEFKTQRGCVPEYEFAAIMAPRSSAWHTLRDVARAVVGKR